MTTPSPSSGGSPLRLLAGVLLIIVAITGAVFGFLNLTRVLDGGGYGTPAMRQAFFILGGAGACLGAGVATVIWDLAKRFER